MHIFIIAASHHLIQVEEAIRFFNIDKSDALLIYMHSHHERIASELIPHGLNYLDFTYWRFRELFYNKKCYASYKKCLYSIKDKNDVIFLYSNQYSSDYVLLANSILKPHTFILLDEGTASISVALERRQCTSSYKLLVKSLLYLKRVKIPSNICFFSQYHLSIPESDSLIIYSFDKNNNELVIDKTSAIILGQALSEGGIVSEHYYIDTLRCLNKDLLREGINRIHYYAHRNESSEKLNHIASLGWIVHENKEPFEITFPKIKPCPSRFYGFYSPILDTLSKKYDHIPEFFVIKIPEEMYMNKKRFNICNEVYNVLRKNDSLTVITINNNCE